MTTGVLEQLKVRMTRMRGRKKREEPKRSDPWKCLSCQRRKEQLKMEKKKKKNRKAKKKAKKKEMMTKEQKRVVERKRKQLTKN